MPPSIVCWLYPWATRCTPRPVETTPENNKMSNQPSSAQLLHAYEVMRTIRAFEDRLHVEFATG